MITIIDKIKLKNPDFHAQFMQWVTDTDYPACQQLKSVVSFQVFTLNSEQADFIEIIQVTSLEAFERDMQTAVFQSLVSRFSQMAEVVEQSVLSPILPGYQRESGQS